MFANDLGPAIPGTAWRLVFFVAGAAWAVSAHGQTLIPGLSHGGKMRLLQTDRAVFESQQPRRDLPCTVTPHKPELGFDFMFRTGYEMRIPIHELVGDGNELTVLYRVIPQDRPDDPSYMVQKISVPALKEDSEGVSDIRGEFAVGEGNYHVDWLVRDQDERVCASSWDLQTRLNSKDSRLRPWVPQSLVQPQGPLFPEEAPVSNKRRSDSLNIAVVARFDPRNESSPVVDQRDLEGVVSILRQMLRDPRIVTFSFVACSSEAEQIIFRQEDLRLVDLPAFGQALASLKLGVLDAQRIPSQNGPAEFITGVIEEQIRKQPQDAVIILSHKLSWDSGRSHEIAPSPGASDIPVFHLTYDSGNGGLFRDPISSIVKRLRGIEYKISRPRDVFDAWSDVVARINRAKQAPQLAPRGGSGGL